jgi:hypothetical protein
MSSETSSFNSKRVHAGALPWKRAHEHAVHKGDESMSFFRDDEYKIGVK